MLEKARQRIYARDLAEGWKDWYLRYDEARRLDWEDRLRELAARPEPLSWQNACRGPRITAFQKSMDGRRYLDLYTIWRNTTANRMLEFGARIKNHQKAFRWCSGLYRPPICARICETAGLPAPKGGQAAAQ